MPIDTPPGHIAIAHVRGFAEGVPLDRALRVTVHFHPDLPFNGASTLEAIADRGAYLSQFETRTGNGGLTAHPGGARWKWESRMFVGAYDELEPAERPKYGSLNYRADPYGGSPRFGSSYFLLAEHTLDRTTFCFPDSVFEPDLFGTAEAMNLVDTAAAVEFDDPLDDYIEAHVHGTIDIASDVEALVLDPSYRDTHFGEIARSLACPVLWHDGYTVGIEEIAHHPDYRGPHVVDLARGIADDGLLTPAILGRARSASFDPQDLKKVWHCIARYGARA
ncbi:DUF3626 domain-containing protein (plasmid) [Rhodococcus pseudokoreensis]|uniref:DUF3626 domain-containing protein n=1 Tax=Rhodococcus pseudokoreensis TaxID=2811421 RepID=A0A974VYP2_9NOCA|nr:DUF3626 domain-containing protein [Rhodococcus pseudokoreensis]QSE88035.1 DUF3626 domain-containing protein [Rhodococcus pseudokoreensis]